MIAVNSGAVELNGFMSRFIIYLISAKPLAFRVAARSKFNIGFGGF